jgi:[acyl-carrier-protein] S-malonyltransferase
MQPAADRLQERLAQVQLQAPSIALINNVDVQQPTAPDQIKDALVRQAAAPVRWVEIIQHMAASGVTHIVECGPGKVLAGLVKRIDPQLIGLSLADRVSLEQSLATIREAA